MRALVPWLSVVLALAAGCQLVAGIDRDRIPQGTGGTGGGSGGTGGIGGTGGGTGGAMLECLHPFDCPGVDTECRVRTCDGGVCGFDDTQAGTPTKVQAAGDCKKRVCDGKGSVQQVDDPTDVLDDHDACTTDTCGGGSPKNALVAPGTSCGGAKVCDASGRCVTCVSAAQCAGGDLCVDSLCVPPSCVNQTKDGGETDQDCGGPACGPCADGAACLVASDCASGVCGGAPPTCLAPACSDGLQNGAESDVDCGAACPSRCGPGQRCEVDGDCVGGKCSGSVCLPACNDLVQNGAETGLDCGGGVCPACALGGGCSFDVDCAEGICLSGLCVPASCADGVTSGYETDVDCGGLCPPCAPGKACAGPADCASGVCASALCAKPSCTDHVRNADETDVDCGGATCPKCAAGQHCQMGTDCAGGSCTAGLCDGP